MSKRSRNISNANLKEIFDFIDTFVPETPKQERDLAILKYAYIDDMTGLAIERLNDERLVSYGNKSFGQPLHAYSIIRIISSYGLEHEKRKDCTKKKNYQRRKDLTNERQKGHINKPLICGCCGSTNKLELHHIIPMANGGTDDYFNLLYLCHDCHKKVHRNMRKGDLHDQSETDIQACKEHFDG